MARAGRNATGDATTDIIQHASVAGELAKNLWGRTDFEKYDSAWAEAKNWMVDYRGGLFTRAGFEFGDVIEWAAGENVVFVDFEYSPETSDTYLCIFTALKVRFAQDNAYVLETAVAIASVANGVGDRITITANAHGFANGDWVKLSGLTHASLLFLNTRTVKVANQTANTFDIQDVITGSLITKAGITTSTGSVSRIYTIVSPYSSAELADLKTKQIRDYVRLTHPDYPIKNLIRSGATSWAISNETIGRSITPPTGLGSSVSVDQDFCSVYQVVAVDEFGEQSLPAILLVINGPDFLDDNRRITISWTAVTGANYYKVYASRAVNSATGSALKSDAPVGYIGRSIGTEFVDRGITPDYTDVPLKGMNPFANGRIRYANVTVQGAGYAYDSTITWPAGGTGASGYLAAEGDGASPILGLILLDGGKDYTGTAITAAGGAGATVTAVLSPATGNNPYCCALFQQRVVYGATDNDPLRLFGSRPGQLSNFDVSEIGADDDSYEFDIDSESVSPIRHLIAMRGGLAVFTKSEVWLVYGREGPLTANNAQADFQNGVGASHAVPATIDAQIIYGSEAGQELRLLTYDDYNRVFAAQNVSTLSNHLFDPAITIKCISYAAVPHKVVYAVQSNGRLIALTIDTQNGVYAATPLWTQGLFRYCTVIEENSESRLYVAVERIIQSTRCLFFERLQKRNFARLEESFCVDAGLSLAKTTPTGRLTPSSLTGTVTFTVTGGTPFVVGDVGKILRCGDGKATISGYTSNVQINGTWTRNLTETLPESTSPKIYNTGEWYLDSTATTIRGMWHLIGQSIAVLADGAVVTGKTVDAYGEFTLTAASRVSAGLAYTCQARTLPPTVSDLSIEGRRKDIVGAAFRVDDTYGLKVGNETTKLYEMADRENRLFSTAAAFQNKMVSEFIKASWLRDQQIYFVQDSPRPAMILSFIRDIDLGDEKA